VGGDDSRLGGDTSVSSVSAAWRMVAQSDWLPMMMPTFGAALAIARFSFVAMALRLSDPRVKGRDYRYWGHSGKRRQGLH